VAWEEEVALALAGGGGNPDTFLRLWKAESLI
jgi:hypothetical protein